jgi:adenine deaminase
VPTARGHIEDEESHAQLIPRFLRERSFTLDSLRAGGWLRNYPRAKQGDTRGSAAFSDSLAGVLHIMQRVGMPILAGTDRQSPPLGLGELHVELAILVAVGVTPLNALQAATLNPAKMLRATDSLGTVAAGKLADLVLLDADPLADITNTAAIRAVVADGRYYDRAALDRLSAGVKAEPIVGP